MAKMTFTSARSAARIDAILAALRKNPKKALTTTQLAPLVGTSVRNLNHYMAHIHNNHPVYIAAWTRSHDPCYAFGDLPDAPKPDALSGLEYKRRQMKTLYADPLRHALHLRHRRQQYRLDRSGLKGADTGWMASLLGDAKSLTDRLGGRGKAIGRRHVLRG